MNIIDENFIVIYYIVIFTIIPIMLLIVFLISKWLNEDNNKENK